MVPQVTLAVEDLSENKNIAMGRHARTLATGPRMELVMCHVVAVCNFELGDAYMETLECQAVMKMSSRPHRVMNRLALSGRIGLYGQIVMSDVAVEAAPE